MISFSACLIAQPSDLVAKKKIQTEMKVGMNDRKMMKGDRMNGMRGKRMHENRGPANGLNLTAEQKESFKKSMLAVHKQLQPLRNELGEMEARQNTLVTADKADLGAINKNLEKIGELRVQMAKIQSKARVELRAQLTDEQRLKFDLQKGKMKAGKPMQGRRMRPI